MKGPVPLRVVPAVLALAVGLAATAGVAGCSATADKVQGLGGGDGAAGEGGGEGSVSRGDGGVADASHDAGHDAMGDADATTACPRFGDAGASVLLYELAAGAFPDAGTPSVAVHVPPGFDPGSRPGVIAFFHGFDNCVANVVGAIDGPCVDGGAARVAMHLVEQLDAARVNAILVAIELDADQATGDPGQLATSGDFRALLHELFTQHLDAVLGCPLDVDGLDRVVVSSHSGGYWATASVLAQGMVAQITEVDLLDSLYGEQPTFDGWMQSSLARVGPARRAALGRRVHRERRHGGQLARDGGERAGVARRRGPRRLVLRRRHDGHARRGHVRAPGHLQAERPHARRGAAVLLRRAGASGRVRGHSVTAQGRRAAATSASAEAAHGPSAARALAQSPRAAAARATRTAASLRWNEAGNEAR